MVEEEVAAEEIEDEVQCICEGLEEGQHYEDCPVILAEAEAAEEVEEPELADEDAEASVEVECTCGEELAEGEHYEDCPVILNETQVEEEESGPTDEELAAEEATEEEEVEDEAPPPAKKPVKAPVRRATQQPAEETDDEPQQSKAMIRRPALALRKPSYEHVPLALLGEGRNDLQRIVRDNLGGGQLSLGDLTRIVMPSGKSLQFEIPSVVSATPKFTDTIEGVLIAHRLGRSFWWESIDEGGAGNPPDCMSHDMIHGLGNPVNDDNNPRKDAKGFLCETCLWNEFGSADPENPDSGKACAERHFLFILSGKSKLPMALAVPPTSLKAVKRYMLGLINENYSFHQVVTRIGLKAVKNKRGVTYGELVFTIAAELDDNEAMAAQEMEAAFKPLIRQIAADPTTATM